MYMSVHHKYTCSFCVNQFQVNALIDIRITFCVDCTKMYIVRLQIMALIHYEVGEKWVVACQCHSFVYICAFVCVGVFVLPSR